MMPDKTQTDSLPVLKTWALQHHRNEIERAILFFAPDHFDWDDCDRFEEHRLNEFRAVIANLTPDLLCSRLYLDWLITEMIDDAVHLLRSHRKQRQPIIRNPAWRAKYDAV
jgi:hypothetical protein